MLEVRSDKWARRLTSSSILFREYFGSSQSLPKTLYPLLGVVSRKYVAMYYLKASSEREDYGGLYIRLQVEDVPLHCGNSLQPGRFLSTPRQDYQDFHQKTVFASRTAFFASFPFTPIRNAKIPLDDPVPVFTNQEDES